MIASGAHIVIVSPGAVVLISHHAIPDSTAHPSPAAMSERL